MRWRVLWTAEKTPVKKKTNEVPWIKWNYPGLAWIELRRLKQLLNYWKYTESTSADINGLLIFLVRKWDINTIKSIGVQSTQYSWWCRLWLASKWCQADRYPSITSSDSFWWPHSQKAQEKYTALLLRTDPGLMYDDPSWHIMVKRCTSLSFNHCSAILVFRTLWF